MSAVDVSKQIVAATISVMGRQLESIAELPSEIVSRTDAAQARALATQLGAFAARFAKVESRRMGERTP